MSVLDFIIFSEIMEATHGDSSGGNKNGCGCIVILAAAIILFFSVGKCGGERIDKDKRENDRKEVGNSTSHLHHDNGVRKDSNIGIGTDEKVTTNDVSTSNKPYTPPPHFNATTIEEARKEGLDYGYDDGEEDGMNNDEDDTFDDSCPYSGRMKKAYQEAYREAYEAGWEDGLDIYNSDREPGEEEADW